MSFRFCFDLAVSANSLKIDFTQSSYYSSTNTANKAAVASFETALILGLGLELSKDFETCYKENYSLTESSCTIHRSANIALVLNLLLSEHGSKMFPLNRVNGYRSDNATEQCMQIRNKHLMDCIGNKDLTIEDFNKVSPLMLAHLNAEYEKLKKEPLVIALKEKPVENYGNDFLKHPLYQTLCFLQQDYTARNANYEAKGFMDRMMAAKPDNNQYTTIYKKYIQSVPDCYCDSITKNYSREKILNEKKINASRVTTIENDNTQSSSLTLSRF